MSADASLHPARPSRTRTGLLATAVASALLLAAPAAHADEPLGADPPSRLPRGDTWDVAGEARLRFVGMRDLGLDTLGTTAGRTAWMESRLVAGAHYKPLPALDIVVEIDALDGQLAGDFTRLGLARGDDTWNVRRHEAFGGGAFLPRKAYLSVDSPFGRFLLGQQAFDWGLGLLANDGVGDPDFGDMYQGSLVERIAFASRPFAKNLAVPELLRGFTFFLGADIVFRDDNASLLAGDFAWNALLGARLATRRFEVGLLEVMRRQRDREDPAASRNPETNVWVTDLQGRVFLTTPFAPRSLQLEAELAFIAGDTTRPYLDETFESGASVLSLGAAARLRYDDTPLRLTAKLEVGYASGDNDPHDDVARQFTFHTDYNVGLILFDQVLPMLSARAVDRISDGTLTAVQPASTRYLVNQGAVSNALYVYPTLRFRPTPKLDLRLGYVFAATDADLIDPYNSARNGGYNATYGNMSPGSHVLGHELDLSARHSFDLGAGTTLRLGYETGMFFQGEALKGLKDDRPVWMARALSDLTF